VKKLSKNSAFAEEKALSVHHDDRFLRVFGWG
jgi:hypothetical protein